MVEKQGAIKLIDFGESTVIVSDSELISNFSGTPVYLAPEIIKGTPYDGKFYKAISLIFGHWGSFMYTS